MLRYLAEDYDYLDPHGHLGQLRLRIYWAERRPPVAIVTQYAPPAVLPTTVRAVTLIGSLPHWSVSRLAALINVARTVAASFQCAVDAVVLIAEDRHTLSTRCCRVRIQERAQGTTIRLEPFPRVLIEDGIGESLID